MKLLYLDCFAGVSGDMFLGALLDLGLPLEVVRAELGKLHLHGYRLETRRVTKQHITATQFEVVVEHEPEHLPSPRDKRRRTSGPEHQHEGKHRHAPDHRGYNEIAAMLKESALADVVKQRALAVFRRLGEVEAKIHGIPLDRVHFHEVGAIDSIVDIVGACIGLHWLQVDAVQAAPPPLGSGFVETAHGRFPVPAPATLALLQGVPVRATAATAELVTPTGAALLAEFCTAYGPLPALTVEAIGYGAGTRDLPATPNVLRAVMGTAAGTASNTNTTRAEFDTVTVIETNIDDMNPQFFGELMDRLLGAGALDVFFTPIQMKKNRPATLLTVLCEPARAEALAELLLAGSTSFGVRLHEARRRKLAREIVSVTTRFGTIAVKLGRLGGRLVTRAPEYDACRQAAAAANVPIKEVYDAAQRAAEVLK